MTDQTTPRVLTIVSCGESKQDLENGETVPARELYTGPPHVCKDRYGRHSHGYYIASAEYGLVHHATELPEYDKTLAEMSDVQVKAWARDVADELEPIVREGGFDAIVIIGGQDYTAPLVEHADRFDAAVLTPWQTADYVTGIGRGMAWCNDEPNWPENVATVAEIAEVVG